MEKSEVQNIVGAIRKLVNAASSDTIEIEGRFSLTSSQSRVLRNLEKSGPSSSAQLCRSLSISPSNMTGIIDRLQNKGLVKRIPKMGDRRIMIIKLTPAGKKISESLPESVETRLVTGLERLEKSEVDSLLGALNKIISMMKK